MGWSVLGVCFMWCVLHVWVLHVVRALTVVVNRVLARSVCGHAVWPHVFVVHVVCCSCARTSNEFFFMWAILHMYVLRVVRTHTVIAKRILVRSVFGHTVDVRMIIIHVVCCSHARASCGFFFMWVVLLVCGLRVIRL